MSKGDFYFPLFYQRLLTSTVGWTDEEFGAYLRLLIYQFDTGFVPGDLKELKKISKKAAKNWKFFSKKFITDANGNFINPVMNEIRQKIQNKREVNSLNGHKGGRPIKPNGSEKITERVTETKGIPIANNQEIKAAADEGAKFYELFRQAVPTAVPDFIIWEEIEKLQAKYPNKPARKSKSLVLAWASNMPEYKPEVKKMVI